ncbi:sulfatase [Rubinisphaera sp. JC750]|uniref:sulfatase family protein n=1 Tax=Rubinisphaera sp. JC750 TaxID=2898658 RepID=UPI001F48FEE9|nr:sulfatase [Rubinisphaera sp. JC750]
MRHLFTSAALLIVGLILNSPSIEAATKVRIDRGGKTVLQTSVDSDGPKAIEDAQFDKSSLRGDWTWEPDETNGNRVTLRGDLQVEFGGKKPMATDHLIFRRDPKSEIWEVADGELKRLTRENGSRRPNVVVVLCDDIRWNALGCAGHPHLVTPNIDQLAAEGVYFENMFCTTSLCSPSRASILSGLYAHTHGVTNNFTEYPEGFSSFPIQLQKSGYNTAYIGKWHMGEKNDEPRPGFDYFVTHTGQGLYYDTTFNINGKERKTFPGYYTHVVTDMAEEWLDQQQEDKPFMLMVGQKAPHSFYLPEPKYAHRYDDIDVNYPQSAFDLDDNPDWMTKRLYTWHGIYGPLFAWRKDHPNDKAEAVTDFANMIRAYWGTINSVDDSVGRLTAKLREMGELDSTVFVFMGDNGLLEGEHGMVDKRTMHEPSIRVPMIVRYPGLTPVDQPKRIEKQVLTLDLAPTLIELCEAEPLEKVHGRSFKSLVQQGDPEWRDAWFYHYNYEKQFPYTPNIRGIRTDRWKYVRYPHGDGSPDKHQAELYDLASDPKELNNLIDDPTKKDLVAKLRKQLDDLMQQADVGADNMPMDEGIKSALPDKDIR